MNAKKVLEEIYRAGIAAVDPRMVVSSQAEYIRRKFQDGRFNHIVPIAFGKAACRMAQGLYDRLGDLISSGIVVTKYGHCTSTEIPQGLMIRQTGHPVPDENSAAAAHAVIRIAEQQGQDVMIVCLVSGGGSSLLALPADGITLAEKRLVIDLLLKAGAGIDELNCVRKHISRIKGGRLAEMLYPTPIVALIISDVIGDKVDVIASGPTAPDTSTYQQAYGVLKEYGVMDRIPTSVVRLLQERVEVALPETPKKGNRVFETVENKIVANNGTALAAAAEHALQLGFRICSRAAAIEGEAAGAGRELAREVLRQGSARPVCHVSGGETTVFVRGRGAGGRNMELALGFAQEVEGTQGIYLLSAGTDGDDNSTGAAGAFVDGSTLSRAETLGLDPFQCLQNNDSYTFFRLLGDLFVTGPTGTNVMDVQIILGL